MTDTGFDLAANLLPFDPTDATFRDNPYPIFQKIRESAPLMSTMPGVFVATGFAEAAGVLRNLKFGHGDGTLVASQFHTDEDGNVVKPFVFMDPPDHTRVRSLVTKAFSARMVERLRPRAQELVEQLIADARAADPDGPVDLMGKVAFALPSSLIGELLGVPAEDRALFEGWSDALGRGLDPDFMLTPEEIANRERARVEFDGYFAALADRRRAEPGEDLVSALVAVEEAGDNLTKTELVSTCRLLLSAGYLSTAHLIGNGLFALLRHPDQLAWLRANPDQITGAVEEMLRYDSPVQIAGMRTALADTEVGEQQVPAGSAVMVLVGAANRDPRVFDDPDRFDISRKPERNLGFGLGIHFCIGSPLARLATQTAIGELVRYDLELADENPPRIQNLVLRGLSELPVHVRELPAPAAARSEDRS